jgi:diguanylate cyclase (GGDEF)-like protein
VTLAEILTSTGDRRDRRVQHTLNRLGPSMVRAAPLYTLLRTDPTDADGVVTAIRGCPGLSARVISVINSVAFGIPRRISSVQRAVNLLGSTRARTLSLAHGLRVINEATGLPPRVLDVLWTNSLTKACAARLFCQCASNATAEEAYALGLIQDIGLPMLMAADLDFYRDRMMSQCGPGQWSIAEGEHFGITHAEIGKALLAEWHAPDPLQDAVVDHHNAPRQLEQAGGDELLSLASFFAGLMPHWHEEPDPGQHEWVNDIHARFLAEYFATPQAFMKQVLLESRQIAGSQPAQDDPGEQDLLRRLVGEVAGDAVEAVTQLTTVENAVSREREGLNQLRSEAFTDPLTKVLNRRGFAVLAERRLREAMAAGESVCCMLSDLDDFKPVNDTYGHDIGDQVLRALSKLVRRTIRSGDLLARIGGDEFAILMVGLDRMGAHAAARHILSTMGRTTVRVAPQLDLQLAVSLGVVFSEVAHDDMSVDELLSAADRAMYHRKHRGKHGMHFVTYGQSDAAESEKPMPRPLARRSTRPAAPE